MAHDNGKPGNDKFDPVMFILPFTIVTIMIMMRINIIMAVIVILK